MFSVQILSLATSCIISLIVALRLSRRRVYPLPLPPGPRGLPFLGNALQLDTKRPWLTYLAWERYMVGKIIHSRIHGIDMIIINSESIARELLDKRSAIYSDRPVIPTSEMAGLGFNTVLLPYGDTLRQHRKIFHQVLRAEASVSYHEMYSRHANELVFDLLKATGDLQIPIQAYTSSLIMSVTYGHTSRGTQDPILTRTQELLDIAKQLLSPERAAIFTAFPFLKKLPVWCFRGAYALMGRTRELCPQLLNEPFDEVKAQMANGTASKSLVADFLSQADEDADEDTMKAVALMGYIGGIDTSTSTLHIFLMAMVLYPDVQARIRAEINQVVTHDKMPSVDDRPSLPYLDAVLCEVLRWYPPIPLGMAHATTNDDIYGGYFIPKGTVVMVNQWALSRDEDIFPDASRFDPTRHLTADGQLKDHFVNHFAFGHARRVCPGRWFVQNSLWHAMAAILAVLGIDHARDSNGNKIEVKPEFTTGMVIRPQPFQYSFEVVNSAREGQLRAMMNLI
ncbi:cytochrome P450 [Suillus fuscotomentosus]|uniref:Cytochrome P450 n=1 Tax=Suillus fuscotomentosus TaxID=1912939 RepID=A0AAD4HFJ5_9AGAM|nr:cytochrome P450 [Suillus fuscotomentosus]KAG1893639.1 cytochrome P450 [Suillus fuscotomentosus]